VRTEFFSIPKRTPQNHFAARHGGSQGALVINRTIVRRHGSAGRKKKRLAIVHQTGERDYNAVRTAYARPRISSGCRCAFGRASFARRRWRSISPGCRGERKISLLRRGREFDFRNHAPAPARASRALRNWWLSVAARRDEDKRASGQRNFAA